MTERIGLIATIGWALVGVAAAFATCAGVGGWLARDLLPDPALLAGAPALFIGCPPVVAVAVFSLPSAIRLQRGDRSAARRQRTAAILGFVAATWMNGCLTVASVIGTTEPFAVHIALMALNLILTALPCGWLWHRAGVLPTEEDSP